MKKLRMDEIGYVDLYYNDIYGLMNTSNYFYFSNK